MVSYFKINWNVHSKAEKTDPKLAVPSKQYRSEKAYMRGDRESRSEQRDMRGISRVDRSGAKINDEKLCRE